VIPAILWVVPAYGTVGAAWVWTSLNLGYLLFGIYFMHRRLLPREKWRWYGQDLASPLVAAAAMAWACRCIAPQDLGRFGELTVISGSACCALLAGVIAAPIVRKKAVDYLQGELTRRERPVQAPEDRR